MSPPTKSTSRLHKPLLSDLLTDDLDEQNAVPFEKPAATTTTSFSSEYILDLQNGPPPIRRGGTCKGAAKVRETAISAVLTVFDCLTFGPNARVPLVNQMVSELKSSLHLQLSRPFSFGGGTGKLGGVGGCL